MTYHLTTAGAIHAVLASAGLLIGLIQLLGAKGTRAHRALGYAYVYGMLVADGTTLLMYRLTGTFNILHVLAMVNLVCIVLAIVPVLQSPRPSNWKARHYYFIAWSYVGLVAAGATQLVTWINPLPTRGQTWMVIAAISALVSAIGYILINRSRPVSGSQAASRDPTIQHDGVHS